jgi:BlaI family transcriptional regulator, penicillinase repressor
MTNPNEPPLPTEAELELLGLLWRLGPSTVREVHAALPKGREIRYTTVLKLLQIMADKGLVRRDESQRAHVYAAAAAASRTQRRIVADLVERAFGGSALRLVQQALSSRPASDDEIRELRAFLDSLEGGRR